MPTSVVSRTPGARAFNMISSFSRLEFYVKRVFSENGFRRFQIELLFFGIIRRAFGEFRQVVMHQEPHSAHGEILEDGMLHDVINDFFEPARHRTVPPPLKWVAALLKPGLTERE